jgi:predicted O-linked N-acetylglucosamine transferase (SPINDLY family)
MALFRRADNLRSSLDGRSRHHDARKTFAGRHSTSHLNNAGYGQFVAPDMNGCVDMAVEWASRLDELVVIRAEMRERVRKSPLCDAERFGRDFLAVLNQAWTAQRP